VDLYTGLALVSHLVRTLVFASVAILAVLFLLDWLARTRKLNPFNPIARSVRRAVDPLILPIERRVVRAGGLPSSAPIWALVGAVIVGVIIVSGVDWVLGSIVSLWFAATSGPMGLFVFLVRLTFGVLQLALLVVVVVSWLPISPYSPWVRWAFALTEPILRPLRGMVPSLGAFDITPIVAYFLLRILEWAFLRLAGM
jgi:YggT family protein